jgi:hypothetical protein
MQAVWWLAFDVAGAGDGLQRETEPGMNPPVEVIRVVRTELDLRGDGTRDSPSRRVTQYWSLDGMLLAEVDPCTPAKPKAKRPPLVPTVTRIVARHYGVTPRDLLGDSRSEPVVTARQVAMRLVREIGEMSFPEIGRAFNRDHSTVMHACKATEGELVGDLVEEIHQAMGEGSQG